jgi:hypothetical protein
VTCLENSPTNLWFSTFIAQGGHPRNLIAHIDERSDYDGLAVAWGINNKKGGLATLQRKHCSTSCIFSRKTIFEIDMRPYNKMQNVL